MPKRLVPEITKLAQRVQRLLHSSEALQELPSLRLEAPASLPARAAAVASASAAAPASTALTAAAAATARTLALTPSSLSPFVSRAVLSSVGTGMMRRLAHTAASQPLWVAPLTARRSVLLNQIHPVVGTQRTFFGSSEGNELVRGGGDAVGGVLARAERLSFPRCCATFSFVAHFFSFFSFFFFLSFSGPSTA